MTETARFFLLLAAAAVLAAGAILAMRNPRVAEARARAFFSICVFAGAAVLLERAGIAGGVLRSVRPIEQAYALVRWIVLGAAAASAILAFAAPGRASFARSAWTLRGLCASTALGFLAIEAGKLAHDAEMREFFTASGYPVALMYAVMAAEVLGAIGLFVPRAAPLRGGGIGAADARRDRHAREERRSVLRLARRREDARAAGRDRGTREAREHRASNLRPSRLDARDLGSKSNLIASAAHESRDAPAFASLV
jgi:hypothetical protein